ncbi:lysozyme inhibitor LprI family protein [Paraburkholderia sp. BL21I4N1]|uniref:lysozyme inhibitor LprI family protein n=1 Tax=Paraburkholderia sp. BL21I4N1 TaxID=1938801 RepID=UPI000CFD9D96|nr:hypothetical protein [Paraburkholderia sp. BL21I4N1]PQV53202.1 uncharacterized protein B0G83_102287 [Paraburkholderia sp. BL21I4N1]
MKTLRPCLIAALILVGMSAHATSFDCNKGRSLTERMICNDPALSTLDDTLGRLYWKARRRVVNRRAFLNDSDSKWAWREANCRDAACLSTWYATRIEELQVLNASLQAGTQPALTSLAASAMQTAPAAATASTNQHTPPLPPAPGTATAMLECTAANPGIVVNEQCSTVLRENGSRWKYKPHGGDWFCGVAMLEPAATTEVAAAAAP